ASATRSPSARRRTSIATTSSAKNSGVASKRLTSSVRNASRSVVFTVNSNVSTDPLRSSKNGDFLSDMDTLQKIFAYFTGVHACSHHFWETRSRRTRDQKGGSGTGDRAFIAPCGPRVHASGCVEVRHEQRLHRAGHARDWCMLAR